MEDEVKELGAFLRDPDTDKVIRELRSRRGTERPDLARGLKALDPQKHDINNRTLRPDKRVRVDDPNEDEYNEGNKVLDMGESAGTYRIERVARVAVALQKLIIKRAVSFLFGNEVAYNASPETEGEEAVLKAVLRVLVDNKTNSLNREIARSVFSVRECAEMWYIQEKSEAHHAYGFSTRLKLRCAVFSPLKGDSLFPYFDSIGDLVAFSRGFSRAEGDKGREVEYFETYTDSERWLWVHRDGGWQVVEGYPRPNIIGKIPIVYAYQPYYETEDVDALIDRLEKLLSNFADTNDYHASPKIFVTGQINGWSKKGEAGAVIEGEEGSTMSYVSWQNAPESVRLEIETLLRMIYTISQTPDISFESVKGLGAISGIALKLLFMDAHLKVQDKREIFDAYLQRRINVVKAHLKYLNTGLGTSVDTLSIEPEITPYILTNEAEEISMWLSANGGKPLVSQRASVVGANLTADPSKDYEQILAESEAELSFEIGEHSEE